jgi:hypothetical protein
VHLAFLTDDLADANELSGHVLVETDDVVEKLTRSAEDSVRVVREADGEVALLDGLEHLDEVLDLESASGGQAVPFGDGHVGIESALGKLRPFSGFPPTG